MINYHFQDFDKTHFTGNQNKAGGMPLLRFKAGEWNSEIIKHRITQALSQN